jgi:hypothetical protein
MVLTTFLMIILGCSGARSVPDPQSFVYIKTQSVDGQDSCENESCPIRLMTSSGSGSVIRHHGDNTYILTAGHVCEVPDAGISVAIAVDSAGVTHDVEKSKYSSDPDLCVMRSSGTWGVPLKISKDHVEYGDRVLVMAAPNGIFAKNMVPLFDGMYSGNVSNGDGVYTLPAMAGSSGSAVLNEELEVVSVIHSATKGFQHIAIGSNTQKISAFIKSVESFINGQD